MNQPPTHRPPASPRRRGRPPSDAARRKVLALAYRILMDEGLGRLSIERVAAESGVGKPTIYRSWANAHDLAMAAFLAGPQVDFRKPRSASVRSALKAHLALVAQAFDTPRGRQITLTMASANPESELAKAFRNQIILKSREVGRGILERGVESGGLGGAFDVEVALDMVYGPLFYRLLAGHLPVDAALATAAVDLLMDGLGGAPKAAT